MARALAQRRRERRKAALLLLVSLAVTSWGTYTFVTAGQWGFFTGGVVGLVVSTKILRNVNRAHSRRTSDTRDVERDLRRRNPQSAPTVGGWQPATIPAPLTGRVGSLARSTVDAQAAAEQRRRHAAIDSAVAVATGVPPVGSEARQARFERSIPAVRPAPASLARASGIASERLASMGKVVDTGEVALDLTDALRRRRTGS